MAASPERTAQATRNRASARLLDLRQLEAEYGGSYWTWRRLLLSGELPLVRLPNVRRLLVDRRDVEACLAKWKEAAP